MENRCNWSEGTFGLAGNTGTHTFPDRNRNINIPRNYWTNYAWVPNNVTLELASDINSITSISFEGTTADANETKLQAIDPNM